MKFRVLPHTSEVGLEAGGRTLPELFRNAAAGLLHLWGLERPGTGTRTVRVRLEAPDLEGLLADWLNEVVYLVQTRRLVPAAFRFSRLDAGGLEAEVRGRAAERLPLAVEIKSATRHGLSVRKTRAGWRARAYLDV